MKIGSEETTQSPVPPTIKAETEVTIDLKPEVETVETENPVADAEDIYIGRPRRCGRLQKESLPATVTPTQHDPDSCPLGPLGNYFKHIFKLSWILKISLFNVNYRKGIESKIKEEVFGKDEYQEKSKLSLLPTGD